MPQSSATPEIDYRLGSKSEKRQMKTEFMRSVCQPIALTLKHHTPRNDQLKVVAFLTRTWALIAIMHALVVCMPSEAEVLCVLLTFQLHKLLMLCRPDPLPL